MASRLNAVLLAAALAMAGLAWVWNSNPWSGPVLWRLSASHGLHSNDWVTIVAWVAAVVLMLPRRGRVLAAARTTPEV